MTMTRAFWLSALAISISCRMAAGNFSTGWRTSMSKPSWADPMPRGSCLLRRADKPGPRRSAAQKNIVRHAHRADEGQFLVNDAASAGSSGARRVGHFNAALEIGVDAGEDFDQGAFARAVFAGQHMDFAGAAFELHVLQNGHRPELLRDAGQADQDGGRWKRLRALPWLLQFAQIFVRPAAVGGNAHGQGVEAEIIAGGLRVFAVALKAQGVLARGQMARAQGMGRRRDFRRVKSSCASGLPSSITL